MKRIVAMVSFYIACFAIGTIACTTLSPAAKTQIAKDQIELFVCAVTAHDCKVNDHPTEPAKCWPVFDDCMIRHGFYDGGADAR